MAHEFGKGLDVQARGNHHLGPRYGGPHAGSTARNLGVQGMPPERQWELGQLRENEALLDRLIAATVERDSRHSAMRQRGRLRRVGVKT
jgi:hypothetical protein